MMDKLYIKDSAFDVKVAVTYEEQERGLMGCPWPPPIMAFPYKDSVIRKFWMKNTISPLDIVFCSDGKVVGICRGEPMSTELVGPNVASDLVVEFPRGTVEKYGIGVGDKVKLSLSIKTAAMRIEEFIKKSG